MSSHSPVSVAHQPPHKPTRFAGLKTVSGRLRRLTRNTQTDALELNLDHHYTTKVYNPGSIISGELHIKPKHDLHFDDVRVRLVGRCQVRQEDFHNASLAYHTFLSLDMPMPASAYPSGKVFLAGATHSIPFHFAVPYALLPTICSHTMESESAQTCHTCLPPTMGGWERDDMSPDLAQIKYQVVAQVFQNVSSATQGSSGGVNKAAMEARRVVRILSPSLGAASLSDTPKQPQVCSKTKTIQKTPFSKPLGDVTLRAAHATAICLSPDGRQATPSLATVDIQFDPKGSEISPPKIDKVAAKLQAHTWYSGTPMADFPDQHAMAKHYSTSLSLGVDCTSDSSWMKHDDNNTSSPKSHAEDTDDDKQSSSYTRTFHLVLAPPTQEKTLLPSFHSCLISRTYKIALSFRFNNETVTLDVPVTIQAEAEEDCVLKDEFLPSFEEALHIV